VDTHKNTAFSGLFFARFENRWVIAEVPALKRPSNKIAAGCPVPRTVGSHPQSCERSRWQRMGRSVKIV